MLGRTTFVSIAGVARKCKSIKQILGSSFVWRISKVLIDVILQHDLVHTFSIAQLPQSECNVPIEKNDVRLIFRILSCCREIKRTSLLFLSTKMDSFGKLFEKFSECFMHFLQCDAHLTEMFSFSFFYQHAWRRIVDNNRDRKTLYWNDISWLLTWASSSVMQQFPAFIRTIAYTVWIFRNANVVTASIVNIAEVLNS